MMEKYTFQMADILGLAETLEATKTGYIQIDGSTPSQLRATYVDR